MSRPDFAQKLLTDLKMRKERMAATQSSGSSSIMSADTYGSSRRSLKGSTDMKSLAKAASNTSKLQRSSSRSQSARTTIENPNQIVPYSNNHTSKQPLDLSMTLSYALDDNGKLKKMNLTGSSAMIGFLRQISSRSMDRSGSSQIQWPSSTQFPTLTNLHVDEVSNGAQRLNKILQSFYNGVNSNGSSVDMGKELLKGAVELEESLRMLVSLQEASEYMVVPKRKSRVKLLEMGEETDEGNDDKDKVKSVERPVFSFDKRAKNEKPMMAITYLKEESNQGKGEKKVSSHRRSASSPVTSSSSSSQVNNKNGKAGISNVVAKLMGLEEIPRNGSASNVERNQLRQSKKGLDQIVSQRMSFGVSRSSEFGDEDEWSIGSHSNIQEGARSNKIVILTSKNIEPQKEIDERKPAWSQREKEQIMTHIMQLNKRSGNEEELKERVLGRKENGGVKRAFPKDEVQKTANLVQGKRVNKEKLENGHEKRSVSKALESRVGRDKSVRDGRIQHPKSPQTVETQGKNQKLEPRNSKKEIKKAPGRKIEASKIMIENSYPKDIHEVKISQEKDAKYETGQKEKVLQEAKDSVAFENSVSTREESLVKLKPDQDLSLHQKEAKSQANETNSLKMEDAAIQKVAHNKKMVKSGPNQKANEVMAKPAKSANRPSRAMKQQATILQGLKQRKPVDKGSRRVESEAVKNAEATDDEFQSCEALHSNQDVNLTLSCDQLDQPMLTEKDLESKPQISELVQVSDNREIHRQKEALSKVDKQQPLTDDEIYLKQILITSQVFLNTAEALFKLNIPIGILNANDITCKEEQDTKLIIDCAYEMLKMKGKRRELAFYPCKNTLISKMRLKTLDDLVRELHKDFETLRNYGKTENSENDQAEYLLKMLERDMYHKDLDVNCMWDMGWKDSVCAYIEMDEVIRDVEKCMINELLDDVLEGFMEIRVPNIHGESMRSCLAAAC